MRKKFKQGKWYQFNRELMPELDRLISEDAAKRFNVEDDTIENDGMVFQATEDAEAIVIDNFEIERDWCDEIKERKPK